MQPAHHEYGGVEQDQDDAEEDRGERPEIASDLEQTPRNYDQPLARCAYLFGGQREHRCDHQQVADPDDHSEQMKNDCPTDEARPIDHRVRALLRPLDYCLSAPPVPLPLSPPPRRPDMAPPGPSPG